MWNCVANKRTVFKVLADLWQFRFCFKKFFVEDQRFLQYLLLLNLVHLCALTYLAFYLNRKKWTLWHVLCQKTIISRMEIYCNYMLKTTPFKSSAILIIIKTYWKYYISNVYLRFFEIIRSFKHISRKHNLRPNNWN